MENCRLNLRELPDDILLNILSKLDIYEQARTSILSSKWTNLWANLWTINTCLNINAADMIQSEKDNQIKTLKFVNRADRILRMHSGRIIDKLEITYPTDPCVFPNKVNRWINVAKQKQVKALYLDFKFRHFIEDQDHVQIFSLGSVTFSSLVTLYLKRAYLSDDIISGLLSNSPNLLELSIVKSNSIFKHLNISGSSLKLRHLELIKNYIICLEISAPNLVSFSFSVMPERIYFKNIPLLTQLSCSLYLTLQAWREIYVLLPQLVTLRLTQAHYILGNIGIPSSFPVLKNLKQMHVRVLSKKDYSKLLALFTASPILFSLSLDVESYISWENNSIENFPEHKLIKEIEIYKRWGSDCTIEIPMCIAKSCSSLRKIIIHQSSCISDYYAKDWAAILPQKDLEIVFVNQK